MPIYEYQCKNGHRVEVVAPISDFKEEIVCRQCAQRNRTEVVNGRGRTVRAILVPSHTAPPKFKRGSGGFYKPTD
jgi:putative FmdB family regulatory protein